MSRRPSVAALAAASTLLAALAIATGCGDSEPVTSTTVPPSTTTSSSTSTLSTSTSSSSTTTSDSTTTAPPPVTSTTESTTTQQGGYDPNQPDSADNDTPPKPGTPQDAFEQACEKDPATCG